MLEFLVKCSKFNFDLKDRWNNSVLYELKDVEAKTRIEDLITKRPKKSTGSNGRSPQTQTEGSSSSPLEALSPTLPGPVSQKGPNSD